MFGASMFDQVTRRQRKHSVMLSQAKKFAPVERREIPTRNALDPLRSQRRANQRAQELKQESPLLSSKKSTDFTTLPPIRRQRETISTQSAPIGLKSTPAPPNCPIFRHFCYAPPALNPCRRIPLLTEPSVVRAPRC